MWMWSTGINRNIVECKEMASERLAVCRSIVLIETLWNVKSAKNVALFVTYRINRNIVECKGRFAEQAI